MAKGSCYLLLLCLVGLSVRLSKSQPGKREYKVSECFNTKSNQNYCLTAWANSTSKRLYTRTFEEASTRCETHIIGSSLIVIKNIDEQINVGRFLRNIAWRDFSILTAGRRIHNRTTSNWTWVTGDEVTFTNWEKGEPENKDEKQCICLRLISNSAPLDSTEQLKWRACNCSNRHVVICQTGPNPINSTVTTVRKSGVTLEPVSTTAPEAVSVTGLTVTMILLSIVVCVLVIVILIIIFKKRQRKINDGKVKSGNELSSPYCNVIYASVTSANGDVSSTGNNVIYADLDLSYSKSPTGSNTKPRSGNTLTTPVCPQPVDVLSVSQNPSDVVYAEPYQALSLAASRDSRIGTKV